MQSVAKQYLKFIAFNSYKSLVTMTPPDADTGYPRAMAQLFTNIASDLPYPKIEKPIFHCRKGIIEQNNLS